MARTPTWLAGLGLVLIAGMPVAASASHYQIITRLKLYGYGTGSPLTADAAGNLYGEVPNNVANGGEVFELTASSGYATEIVLYAFTNEANGGFPIGGVTLDNGQIIGTAGEGAVHGSGTAFNLGVPGQITLTTLHYFNPKQTKPPDGARPGSGLIAGPGGLFYGTTAEGGGPQDAGTVFSISDSITAPVYAVLHRFGHTGDGINPYVGQLIWDGQKRLYGTTYHGGANGAGTVFMTELTRNGWQERVLYSFAASTDVNHPFYGVVMDNAGALYGCAAGGTNNEGGVFQLTPPVQEGGAWQETVLYNFGATAHDANASINDGGCGLTIDPIKKLIIGTTSGGGTYGSGTIWQLKPPTGGQSTWQEAVDHSFFSQRQGTGGFPIPPPAKIGKVYYGVEDIRGKVYAFTP